MKWLKRLLPSQRKVVCPDGTTKFVYRDIDDALPLYVSGWDGKASAKIEAATTAPVEISAQYSDQLQTLLFQLDNLNQSMMMNFRGVYAAYASDPCNSHDFFRVQVQQIIEGQSRLRSLRVKTESLVSLMKARPEESRLIFSTLSVLLNETSSATSADVARLEIADHRAIAANWARRGNDS